MSGLISKIAGLFRKRGFLWLVIAVMTGPLLSVAGVAVWWFWREHRFEAGWKVRQAGLEARGIPVRPGDLLPAPPAPDANAAALLAEAVELQKSIEETEGASSAIGSAWKEKSADPAWRKERLTEWENPAALRIAGLVGRAVQKPALFVERDRNDPLAMSLEPNVSLLKLSQWLAMRAAVFAREGRADDALASIESIFRLAEFCQSEPLLISFLVGASIERLALDALEIFLQCPAANQIDPARCESLQSRLAVREERIFPEAVRALDGERIFFSDFLFGKMRASSDSAMRLLKSVNDSLSPRPLSAEDLWLSLAAWAYQYPLRSLMDADQMAMADFQEKTRARFARPLDTEGVFMDFPKGDLVRQIPKHAILTRLSAPALDGVFELAKVQVERIRLARVALAAFEFRRARGGWPGTPQDLLGFDQQAPITDRLTGRLFVWKVSGERLEIESNAFGWPDEKLHKNRRRGLSWRL